MPVACFVAVPTPRYSMAATGYDDSPLAVIVDGLENEKALECEHAVHDECAVVETWLDEKTANSDELGPEWPVELQFLKSARCNPDFSDKACQKRGYVRAHSLVETKKEERATAASRLYSVRLVTDIFVNSWTFQSVVMAIIFFDIVLTIYSFIEPESESVVFEVGDYLVLIVLTFDVLARFFVKGCIFLRGYLNVFELFLLPVTCFEIFVLRNMNIPVQLLRVLRPVFRGFRLMRILVRTASKTESYLLHLRHKSSGDRLRFMQDGFDLDMAYITNQITVMTCPAVGQESWLCNPANEVARFYNERHTNNYLILNTTGERSYPLAPFFDRYLEFPILKNGVPSLDALLELCETVNAWLHLDPQHHLAVHSQYGQGRSSLVVMALLICNGVVRTPASAIRFFEQNRLHPDSQAMVSVQCCDSASQLRFLEYFARRCHERRLGHGKMPPREVRLVSIEVCGLPCAQTLDVECFNHSALEQSGSKNAGKNEEDAAVDDEISVAVSKKARTTMTERLHALVDESTYDSLKGGGMPATTPPLFSSVSMPDAIKSKSLAHQAGGLAPGIWELEPITACGELKIEISRRRLSGEESKHLDDPEAFTNGVSKRSLLRFIERKDPSLEQGLMFSCWLHTDFLEQDEEKSSTRRGQHQKRLTVSIDRFSLDKAAHAPALKSYAESLALKLTFEVDERQELIPLGEVSKQKTQGPTSRLEMSQPETMEWLSFVGHKIWPNFEMSFRKMLEDNLISLLKTWLPAPFNENVALRSFSLGNDSPKFGPIVALSKHHDRGKQVQLNFGLDYTTNTDVVIELGIAKLGMTQLSIKGTLCVKFKPLLTEIPVLCAMQLFFLNAPQIHIQFGNALALANLSIVQIALNGAIHDELCGMLVLPNVMNINWGDPEATSDSAVTFVNESPCAVLRVGIRGAKNLKAATSYLWRPQDTFVKVSVGENHAESKTVTQTTDPVFDETFDFVVYDEYQHVTCGLYDVGITGSHDPIGALAAGISVAEIASVGKEGAWIDLVGTPDNISSQIHITAQLFELRNDAEQLRHLLAGLSQVGESSQVMAPGQGFSKLQKLCAVEVNCARVCCMMLVCQVVGGKTEVAEMAANRIDVRVKLGSSFESQKCAPYPEFTTIVDEKLRAAIHKLHDLNYDVEAIADILQEPPEDIQFALRSKQFNLLCPQKICVLAKPHDLASASDVEFAIVERSSGMETCQGKLSMQSILAYEDACRKEHVACKDSQGQMLAELDVEIKLFSLQAMERVLTAERALEKATDDDSEVRTLSI
eukprot:TRINITY_DN14753_c0_g1_i1.p1 TRINITY_DN14753_c0_g1~~TRINITY_DN14753_c0_g1_i1.p1  ORF type:complete len:1280 (+),score=208.81 TRINITY_DN14753_c0_g1_i1:39-3878(+)